MSPTLTVVAPLSVMAWYDRFCGTMDDVVFIGEDAATSEDVIALASALTVRAAGRPLRLMSGHDSLLRDWVLAQELRARGLTVVAQSGVASAAALDKVLQKQLLVAAGIAVPDWGLGDTAPPPGTRALWKGRTSTQSRDITWHAYGEPGPPDTYWERWVEGVEYSVVVHRDCAGTVRFPPVWKGEVREDLSPPWRRLRLVPSGAEPTLLAELDRVSTRIAELLDWSGFGEIEFILSEDGYPLVTDINPRICGTMRIVAMATKLAIFDPSALARSEQPKACHYAAEMPYNGPAIATDTLIATSRLTSIGDTPTAALEALSVNNVVDLDLSTSETLPGPWNAY